MKRPVWILAIGIGLAGAGGTAASRADDAPVVVIAHGLVFVPGHRAPLQDGTVVLAKGKVQSVGTGSSGVVPPDARVIDARGKVVTPGFIDGNSAVGVVDVDEEGETSDTDSRGLLVPALRMADGYNPRSVVIPITRSGGVTSVVVAPHAGALAGQSTFVDLAGETQAEAIVRPSLAQYARVDEGQAQEVGTRGGLWMLLREALDDARFYSTHRAQYDANAVRQLGLPRVSLEALLPVLRGEEPLVITAHRASDIETALRFASEFRLRILLEGASEAWLMADEIAKAHVSVILDPLEDLPQRFDRLRSRSDNAALLSQAGVSVVLATFSSHQSRLLWQRAGNAVRLGMDHDAAIRAVTEAPAEAFGLRGYGRLEAGAVGNLVIWSGDPLQIGSRVEHVFVRGREQSLETRQTLLLNRYRSLPFIRDGSR
jgi:imidazolonepropionase-like amidohydrolase